MKFSLWQRFSLLTLLLIAFCISPLVLSAQDDSSNGPPKILVIEREFTKPGDGGTLHEKTEGAIAQELREAKSPWHYIALRSISGPPHVLFLSGFSSLGNVESTHKAAFSNPALMASMERLGAADSALLSKSDTSFWMLRDDLSLNDHRSITGARYMRLSRYQIRPGHEHEWEAMVSTIKDALQKNIPEANWALFENVYGADGDIYITLTPLKSMNEEDGRLGSDKQFTDAMGPDGMKKLHEVMVSSVVSEEDNLFYINPRMSYPPDSWVTAEPDFWRPKTETHARKAETHKPAAAPAQQ